MRKVWLTRTATVGAVAGLAFVFGGCEQIGGPNDNPDGQIQFTQEITLSEFEGLLNSGQARVEIDLSENGMVAREIEIETPDELAYDEEIESRAMAIEATGSAGSVTLELGDLAVGFNEATRLLGTTGEELPLGEFIARIDAALGDGAPAPIKVRRPPLETPQSPTDATFLASELRLIGQHAGTELELNLTADNFETNAGTSPDGWILVLGLEIEIRVTEGVTEIEREGEDASGAVEFEGTIESVNLDARSFILTNDIEVRLVDASKVKEGEGLLSSLRAVVEVMESGKTVFAYGEATEEGDAHHLIAINVAFQPRDEALPVEDFEGVVASVNLDLGTATLENGIVIRLGDHTTIKEKEGFLHTLGAVAEALGAEQTVVAWGEGEVESENPLTILAIHVAFFVREDPKPVEKFEGIVEAVNIDLGKIELTNGIVVQLGEGSTIKQLEHTLHTLAAVQEALELGKTVIACGEGTVEGENPLTILAFHITFEIEPVYVPFEGVVAEYDGETQTLVLGDGTTVKVTSETLIKEVGTFKSLDALVAALADQKTVIAHGEAEVQSEGPPAALIALHVQFDEQL